MLKGAQASAAPQADDVQFVDLMTYVKDRPDWPTTLVSDAPDWRASRCKRLQARLISHGSAIALVAALGVDAALAHRRARALRRRSSRSGRQPIMAFWHGRILPATYYFRRRGIVVITSENFDGEWIAGIIERFGYGTARGSTSRGGAQGAAAADARHGGGQAGRVHARRPARSGARRAARRRLAGEGDRQPGAAVSPRSRPPLDAEQLGPHADPEAVRDGRASRWASRSRCAPMRTRQRWSGRA